MNSMLILCLSNARPAPVLESKSIVENESEGLLATDEHG
jgi:hypothetical protein